MKISGVLSKEDPAFIHACGLLWKQKVPLKEWILAGCSSDED